MNNRITDKAVIYNIYPTSFFDSNGDGVGDLAGITQKLEYVAELADYVWINPVFASPFKDGGYDITDYYAIDERFGTMDDLKALIRRADELGLKVLLDLVVGHTSDEHPWFKASQKSERNEYSDRYIWTDGVFDYCPYRNVISGNSERNGNYFVNFFYHQPALNFGFTEVKHPWQMHYTDARIQPLKDEVVNIICFYMEMGVAGFRVDMANSIVKGDKDSSASTEVWNEIFGKVREKYPHATFISEWGIPARSINAGYDIDFITHCHNDGYNRLFRKEAGTNVITSDGDSFFRPAGRGEADTFFDYFLSNLESVGERGFISVPSGNHDLPRLALDRSDDGMKAAFALILALPCVPLIYYGDEIGIKFNATLSKDGGYNRTGARTPMQWSAEKNAGFSTADADALYLPVNGDYTSRNAEAQASVENSLSNTVKRLLKLRKSYPQLGSRARLNVISRTYPLVLKLSGEKSDIFALINPSAEEHSVTLTGAKILESNNVTRVGDTFTLGAESFAWIEADKDAQVVI